ncbi:MAG TPA: methyl-accepting chemotaxis protein [Gemmatimonadaceae bacterium]|nr:methyl-accepting chemotaxis protein [Gemmatimonadaceae bacterium]
MSIAALLARVGLTGISRRLLLPILGVTIVALSLVVGVVARKSTAAGTQAADLVLEQMAHRYAGEVEAELEKSITPARTLAQLFAAEVMAGRADRSRADSALKQVLANNPQIIGVWTAWEPDAFDGRDAEHVGARGSDATGRFIPYWRRGAAGIDVEALVDYEKDGAGNFYVVAKRTGQETVLDPYAYAVDGKQVLMTSLVVPVILQGGFRGAVGVDVTLDGLQELVGKLRPYGNGFASLIANNLTYAAHDEPELLGQDIGARIRNDSARAAIQAGRTYAVREHSEARGMVLMRRFVPLTIGQSVRPWSLVIHVPEDTVLADARATRDFIVMLGVITVVLLGGVVVFVVRRLVRPVSELAVVARRVAEGDVRATIAHRSDDEVGELAEAFRAVVASQQALATAARRLAAGDVAVEVAARGDADELGRAVAELRDTVRALTGETTGLVASAAAGDLGARGHATRFQGAYRDLIQGINDTLDAIVTPINEAGATLERLAARDLTARMKGDYRGDHARIKTALNEAAEALDAAMLQVAAAATQVSSAGTQITSGSQSLAEGASEQAASLEEISSSLQEMVAMATQSAGNAAEARNLAAAARAGADEGVARMGRLTEAMDRIKASSDQTAKIVKTIDEIAFQTNLLALNAAVEAARAGEAGRGFAVVAEEVRSLALRSAKAAKNTAALIEEAVQNAEGGVATNAEVLTALRQINGQVVKVTDVMDEIAAASEQQAHGVSQINTAIEQMNGVTQQVAANAEESASAATELESQARGLDEMVSEFTLTDAHGRRAASSRPEPTLRSRIHALHLN